MNQYRIYTEDKNRVDITDYITKWTPGFTVYRAYGFWKGIPEDALVIEFIEFGEEGNLNMGDICKIADWIKAHNDQQSVLVTNHEITEVEYVL